MLWAVATDASTMRNSAAIFLHDLPLNEPSLQEQICSLKNHG
jgi:hypothetical protein